MTIKINSKKQVIDIITEAVKREQKNIIKQIKKLLDKKQKIDTKNCLKNKKS